MAWSISDALTRVREILNDEDSDEYRYSDESLIGILNVAILETRGLRPDAFVFGEAIPMYTVDDLEADFPIPLTFYSAVTYFVAGYAELRDDEFTENGRAMLLMQKFRTDIKGDPPQAARNPYV